jgi:hypothetical protein
MSRLAARWKLAGKIVLVAGLLYAPVHYVVKTRQAEERLGDLLPSYDKTMNREMRVQMGTLGIVLMQWSDALAQPGTQAVLIAVGAALSAKACSYVAERVDEQASPDNPDA